MLRLFAYCAVNLSTRIVCLRLSKCVSSQVLRLLMRERRVYYFTSRGCNVNARTRQQLINNNIKTTRRHKKTPIVFFAQYAEKNICNVSFFFHFFSLVSIVFSISRTAFGDILRSRSPRGYDNLSIRKISGRSFFSNPLFRF